MILSLIMLALQRDSTHHQTPVPPHNVLIFVLDEASVIDMADIATPNIDYLASRGVSFSNAYSNPSCNVSRRSLYYGQWWTRDSGPTCDGSLNGNEPLAAQTSIAELVPCRSALIGKWHVGPGLDGLIASGPAFSGFDHFLAGTAANIGTCGSNGYTDWLRIDDGVETQSSEYEPIAVLTAFTDWWSHEPRQKVAVFNANLAHAPFSTPPSGLLPVGYPTPTTNRTTFLAMLVAYDTLIGMAMQSVSLADTTVFVVSDNGTPTNAGGGLNGKGTVFERGTHVPMLVSGLGVTNPGRSCAALTHLADVYPTMAELLGASASSDGISLVPAMADQAFTGHDYVLCGDEAPPTGDDGSVAARSLGYLFRRSTVDDSEQFYVEPDENDNRINSPAYATEIAAHRAWLDLHLP